MKKSSFPRQPNPWSPYLLLCDCSSTEHQITFDLDPENASIYCHIHLVKRPFFKRIKYGLKYIFGYNCRLGHWDQFIFNPDDAWKLKLFSNFLSGIKENRKIAEEMMASIDACEKITLK